MMPKKERKGNPDKERSKERVKTTKRGIRGEIKVLKNVVCG